MSFKSDGAITYLQVGVELDDAIRQPALTLTRATRFTIRSFASVSH